MLGDVATEYETRVGADSKEEAFPPVETLLCDSVYRQVIVVSGIGSFAKYLKCFPCS